MWEPALSGHSTWFDLARMVEFDAAVRHGEFLPTWSPRFLGYGSPLFSVLFAPGLLPNRKYPLLAGFDFPAALKITQLRALYASGLAMLPAGGHAFFGLGRTAWGHALHGRTLPAGRHLRPPCFGQASCAFIWLPLIIWGTERVGRGSNGGARDDDKTCPTGGHRRERRDTTTRTTRRQPARQQGPPRPCGARKISADRGMIRKIPAMSLAAAVGRRPRS